MNKLEEVLVKYIEKAAGSIEKGVEFALEQAPEIIEQLLRWEMVSSGLKMLLALVMFGILIKFNLWQFHYWKEYYKGHRDVHEGLFANFLQLPFIIIASILFNLTWLKIWIAPKVWLIEYAASLVK
jgi:hypothetical protein